jgi:SAM-dependent methyltransferase
MKMPDTDKSMLFSALQKQVGDWYENAYGDRAPYSKMIEFYASGTERRIDILLGPLKEQFYLQPPLKVLDVGCGYASIPVYLAWQWGNSDIFAIDRTDSYYACGKAAACQLKLTNIKFATRNLEALNDVEEFDLVMSCNMLNFMTSKEILENALIRLARATKKKGYLIIYTPHFWSFHEPFTSIPMLHFLPRTMQDKIVRILGKRSGLLDVRNPSLGEFSRILVRQGFNRIGVSPMHRLERIRRTHISSWFQKQ